MSRRSLRPHQLDAFRYCRQQRHPALFMEMRLMKSLLPIRRMELLKPQRILIVGPIDALDGWAEELDLEGYNDPAWLLGKRASRRDALKKDRLYCLFNKEGWKYLPEVALQPWDAVVLDESTFIKNPKAKVTKFYLKNFRNVPHRWALTGTPDPEGIKDLWCQLAWLDGHAFGYHTYWAWRAANFEPDPWGHGWAPKPGVESRVRRVLADRAFMLTREQAGLKEEWIEETRWFDMPPKLRKAYETCEREFLLEWDGEVVKDSRFAGARYQWLRQLTRGWMDGKQIWKEPEDALVRMATGELAREPIVIWFTYNNELHSMGTRCEKARISYRKIHGAPMKKAERSANIRAWKAGEVRVLLAQVSVGKYALKLSRSDTVLYYSAPCGYEMRQQSQARIVDTDKDATLLCLDFATRNTVDQDLHAATHDKRVRSERTFREVLKLQMEARLRA